MGKLRKTVILILVAGLPAAAPAFLAPSPDLCFASGSVTYRLSADGAVPDIRIAFDNAVPYPDLRVGLVDRVDTADFALTDDAGMLAGSACKAAGLVRVIRIVEQGKPADMTLAMVRGAADADVTLYVHSARVSHFAAAALFAAIRRGQALDGVAEATSEGFAELH
jgi:hypothetical protein